MDSERSAGLIRTASVGATFEHRVTQVLIGAGGHAGHLRKMFDPLVTCNLQTGAVDLTVYLTPGECRAVASHLLDAASHAEDLSAVVEPQAEAA